jgi:3',5'-cyclic AMP phosphodiesterase CpdA
MSDLDPVVPAPEKRISRRDLLRGIAAAGAAAALSRYAPATRIVSADSAPSPVRFGLIGDWGNGDDTCYAVAEQMAAAHGRAGFDMVITAGDNIYPDGSAKRFAKCFEEPYDALISKGIQFHASLGNHDVRDGADAQCRYPLFGMGGCNYYKLSKGDGMVDVFMLDSNDMSGRQVAWLERELRNSTAVWKVPVFHHPLYSSGRTHGSDDGLRRVLEPVFVANDVKVAFSGHDHIYQRVTPQRGIQYFVSGAGGKVREGDLHRDELVASGFDKDGHFMVLEADARRFAFTAISARGEVIDSGELAAPRARAASAA